MRLSGARDDDGRRLAPLKGSPAAWAAVLSFSVLALVAGVALGSSRSLAHVGGPGQVLHPQLLVGDLEFALVLLYAAALAATLYVMWDRWRRAKGRERKLASERPAIPWWVKLLVAVLALMPVAALMGGLVYFIGHRGRPRPRPISPPPASAHSAVHHATTVVPGGQAPVHWWVWGALAVIVAVAALIALARWHYANGKREGGPWGGAQRVLPAVIEESLADIEREADARRAVIRAYVGMERALAGHGLARLPSETPQEYLSRALSAVAVSRPAGERLTGLFQQARFSAHPVAGQMKRDAIAALVAVREELVSGAG